ncbi:hypothetical protein MBLNU13_g08905t1 [Cladosporium sp. NU13]
MAPTYISILTALVAAAFASPLEERNLNCNAVNTIITLMRQQHVATPFCSSLLSIPTVTSTYTQTSTPAYVTVTQSYSSVQTVTAVVSSVVYGTTTIYPVVTVSTTSTCEIGATYIPTSSPTTPARMIKRALPPPGSPPPSPAGTTPIARPTCLSKFGGSAITSACLCLNIPTPTKAVIATVTLPAKTITTVIAQTAQVTVTSTFTTTSFTSTSSATQYYTSTFSVLPQPTSTISLPTGEVFGVYIGLDIIGQDITNFYCYTGGPTPPSPIPAPTGKYCPARFREWTDLAAQQTGAYNTDRSYLHPTEVDAPRLFSPLIALQDLRRSLCLRTLSSEKDLEGVERYGKDHHVHDIVSALCENPHAREELRLGNGYPSDSHAIALDEETAEARGRDTTSGRMQPDQFCIHRLDGDSSTLLMTVKYKPPHKLSTENLCAGLRPMDFWEEVVNSETVSTDKAEKLRYNVARLAGAAIVQEYHVMIQEGLTYSCLSTGIAMVIHYVPEEEPTTLYYRLCVPNEDVRSMGEGSYLQPVTAVARLLCLGLMSCATSL